MKRIAFFVYGVTSHGMFLLVYAALGFFVTGQFLPRTIDGPTGLSGGPAAMVNTLLLLSFGVPHSVMARPGFKAWWTQIIPKPIERSTYVLISNLLVLAMMAFWQPIESVVWHVQSQPLAGLIWSLSAIGWLLVPLSSLLINHFDLLGTRQVWLYMQGKAYSHLPFASPLLYRIVRHPLYVGWLLAFWATPYMTVGHLQFAGILTAYILIAIRFEERDLLDQHGERYAKYRREVPMLIPSGRRPQPNHAAEAPVRHEPAL
ncbi:methanethiol S-methyltransferase [Humisphaera borealis]|uniref:methanethiol S-methyltransferase n=1 Tax=Humisphaera borealis TaxID=2807512 RepID=A0A7M2WWB1_9BACT|nr:methanethiol S-methyltransferase [Humisphaera borealis]QOV88790.1 isoprenylcysteine carboxylmethyltransferase family protein [Humisphaera borealis]